MLQKYELPLFSTLKTEAARSSKTSLTMYHTTWCNNSLASNCHSHWHENLKSHTFKNTLQQCARMASSIRQEFGKLLRIKT
jgi:superoxide dismutase